MKGTTRARALGLMLAVAVGATLSAQREWRDYAGGPDSSRFVAATQITKANVGQLQVAWTYRPGRPTSTRSSCAASSTAAARATRSSRSMPPPASSSGCTRRSRASTRAA